MTPRQRLRGIARGLRLRGGKTAHKAARLGIWAWRSCWTLLGLATWAMPWLRTVLRTPGSSKRLLAIWDTAAQPHAIGDMLTFHAGALAASDLYGASKIDFCILSDEHLYKIDTASAEITADNRFRYGLALMRLVQTNPKFGSLIYLDSRSEFDAFISRNEPRYHFWPPFGAILGKEYVYHRVVGLLADEFRRTGKAPRLSCTASLRDWASSFLRTHAPGQIPIVVQFRHNLRSDQHRNSNPQAWFDFFERCRGRFPVTFFVISGSGELDPRLRGSENVIITKDSQTVIEEDLALIEAAAGYLATASGPAWFVFCTDVPYSVLNWPEAVEMSPELYPGLERAGDHLRFVWATSNQRLIPRREEADELFREFERLLGSVDSARWVSHDAAAQVAPVKKLRLW